MTPELIRVQQRVPGDNLAGGCKVDTEDAVDGETCDLNSSCFDVGS